MVQLMFARHLRKGQMLPHFFEKIMLIGLVAGVVIWMIYSSINSEEVVVIMRQERNDVELWHQVLKADMFRAETPTTGGSVATDYRMYFDKAKIEQVFTATAIDLAPGGAVARAGDISCASPSASANCINFHPNRYFLNISYGSDSWLFTNNGPDTEFPKKDIDYKYREVIGILVPTDPNPGVGMIMFTAELYE